MTFNSSSERRRFDEAIKLIASSAAANYDDERLAEVFIVAEIRAALVEQYKAKVVSFSDIRS